MHRLWGGSRGLPLFVSKKIITGVMLDGSLRNVCARSLHRTGSQQRRALTDARGCCGCRYNLQIEQRMPLARDMLDELLLVLPPCSGKRVLDLCAGAGRAAGKVLEGYPEVSQATTGPCFCKKSCGCNCQDGVCTLPMRTNTRTCMSDCPCRPT